MAGAGADALAPAVDVVTSDGGDGGAGKCGMGAESIGEGARGAETAVCGVLWIRFRESGRAPGSADVGAETEEGADKGAAGEGVGAAREAGARGDEVGVLVAAAATTPASNSSGACIESRARRELATEGRVW